VEGAGVELRVVHLLCDLLQFGVGAVGDAGGFDGVFRGNLAVAIHIENRHRLDSGDLVGVDPVGFEPVGVGLRLLQGEVVVGAVGRHRHDDTGGAVGVDELGRKDDDLVVGHRVGDGVADDLAAGELAVDIDVAILQFEFFGRFRRDQPLLAVDRCLGVGRLGVDVGVGDTTNRLGPERRHRDNRLVVAVSAFAVAARALAGMAEPDQGVLLILHVLAFEQVVGRHRVLLFGAVFDRVEALFESTALFQRLVLPGDELGVAVVVGRELAPPVDREPQRAHPLLVVFLDEVVGVAHRRFEVFEHVVGDVVGVLQDGQL